jgi:nitrate reductase alpha subunit
MQCQCLVPHWAKAKALNVRGLWSLPPLKQRSLGSRYESSGRRRVDGKASDALLKLGKFFTRWEETDDGRVAFRKGGRAGDVFYRDRWSHDKVVRSTHGVNCTGSCSWKIYVRDGIITWEAQQTDYPSVGPDRPEYEPRGCPRGAAFSWYTYSLNSHITAFSRNNNVIVLASLWCH